MSVQKTTGGKKPQEYKWPTRRDSTFGVLCTAAWYHEILIGDDHFTLTQFLVLAVLSQEGSEQRSSPFLHGRKPLNGPIINCYYSPPDQKYLIDSACRLLHADINSSGPQG